MKEPPTVGSDDEMAEEDSNDMMKGVKNEDIIHQAEVRAKPCKYRVIMDFDPMLE